MQVTLKPLSHPELGDIVIQEQLFPIGRGEQPFDSYNADLIAHLSRRHARIFWEEQGIYIADLGSRNGTRLNGKPVEFKPCRLLTGDRLSFAGLLDYEIEIRSESGDTEALGDNDISLTLQPMAAGSPLDAQTITRFPHLISKSDSAFAGVGQDGPDPRGFLSRRHAHIFSRGGRLFIEDLASTNGTFLNGERLDEHARPLSDGDELLFGGDYFSYRVLLRAGAGADPEVAATEAGEAPATPAADEECHTTYVTSADSFLDIFCVDADDEEPVTADEEPAAEEADDKKPARKQPVRPGLWQRVRTFGAEFKTAFGDGEARNPRARWIATGTLALVGALALALYLSGKPRRDVENLLAQERYRDAAELASAELAADPDQEVIAELATEALARYAIEAWLDRLTQGDYASAHAVLADARLLADNNPRALELLDILEWVADLQQFVARRGGADAAIQMYEHEEPIETLLAWWNRDPEEHRSRMNQLLNYYPEFKTVHDQAFSQLRSLRNEKSVYLAAIDKLDDLVVRKLAEDRPEDLIAEFDEVATQYPRLGGLDRLRNDLENYLLVQAALAQDNRLRAAMLIENREFSTPPFRAKIAGLQTTLLPTEEVARQFSEAAEAWRAGELQTAMELLAGVAGQQGGELAAQELESKQRIIASYDRLRDMRGTPEYGEYLVNFYVNLDPVEDVYFTRALQTEFERHREAALQRADEAWHRAQENWDDYRQGGGIEGLLRLEEQVSRRFGEQASLLSEAHRQANYAAQVHTLLGVQLSGQQAELHRKANAEINLQRRSLEQLSMVLSPEVLDTKLGLLAPVNSPSGMNRSRSGE